MPISKSTRSNSKRGRGARRAGKPAKVKSEPPTRVYNKPSAMVPERNRTNTFGSPMDRDKTRGEEDPISNWAIAAFVAAMMIFIGLFIFTIITSLMHKNANSNANSNANIEASP